MGAWLGSSFKVTVVGQSDGRDSRRIPKGSGCQLYTIAQHFLALRDPPVMRTSQSHQQSWFWACCRSSLYVVFGAADACSTTSSINALRLL